MSTKLGTSTKPTSSQEWSGVNALNQQATALTLPAGGPWVISKLGAWMAGKDAAVNTKLVLWNSTRNSVLGQSAQFSATGHAFGSGNSDNYEKTLVTPVTVNGGTTVYVGWSRDPAGAAQFGRYATGTHYDDTQTGSWPAAMSGEVSDTPDISAYLYYDAANSAPNAPTLSSPINTAIITTATPALQFTGSDPDVGDTQQSYDLQVSTDITFASVTHWNISAQTTGQTGFSVNRTYAGTALVRGTTYYWRARTTDNNGATGAWSSAGRFRYNALPTVSARTPGSAALGFIHNLAALATWTSGGTDAQCQFKFTYNDTDSDAMTKYQLRVYNDNAGVAGTLLYDSGQVALAANNGNVVTINFTGGGFVNGTQYWWSIDVFDGTEWAGESAKTAFKVRWAQGIFENNSGATSTNWQMATGTILKYAQLLFRSATSSGGEAATGKTAWNTNIAAVTVQAWTQVLVRLSTDTAGSTGSLADMTLSYYGTPSLPDGWTAS